MAVRKTTGKKPAAAGKKAGPAEQKVVALAEQLGWFLGTAKARADGWIGNVKVRNELTRIRDGAALLLQHIDAAARAAGIESSRAKASAKPAGTSRSAAPNVKASRGPVDAPGKRHRKPPPQEKLTPAMKRMGEPKGKQMGQKNFKMGTGKRRITG
ncbi:MAG: hypothetical protein AB7N29_14800 [Vicinamibacterales bacterium]